MSTPQCYKCKTENELSVKRTLKSGHMLFICRSCRREYSHGSATPSRVSSGLVSKKWIAMAKEKNKQVALQHRDETFMKAMGLL